MVPNRPTLVNGVQHRVTQAEATGPSVRLLRGIRWFMTGAAAAALVVGLANAPTVAPCGGHCSTVIASCPLRGEALIVELCRQGRVNDAVEVVDSYLARPNLPLELQSRLHFLRAGAMRLLERDADARLEYRAAAALMPPGEEMDVRMELLAQGADYQASNTIARHLLEQDNLDSYEVNNVSWQLAVYPGGTPRQAVVAMARIVPGDDSPADLDTYAWGLYRSGDRNGARAVEREALRSAMASESPHAAYYHACLEGMDGQPEVAHSELLRIFQNDITCTSAWTAAERFSPHPFGE